MDGRGARAPEGDRWGTEMSVEIHEPIGSMSLSPAQRDVVLGARKGLFIVDLANPYDHPRFLRNLTTWEVADIQWNPHACRAHWVASTSNQKLLIWNLDRPPPSGGASDVSQRGSCTPAGPSEGSHLGSVRDARSSYMHGRSMRSNATLPSWGSPRLDLSLAGLKEPTIVSTMGAALLAVTRGEGSVLKRPAQTKGWEEPLSPIEYVLESHRRAITDINWSPFHPDIVASCGIDTWTWVWDLRMVNESDGAAGVEVQGKPAQGYSAWNASATQVKWNRADEFRLATSVDNKILIWDSRKGALPLATIEGHVSRVYGLDWSRDTEQGSNQLITCSLDGMVKYWDLSTAHAQEAIGKRELITEPTGEIQTPAPLWRARHLPFGEGVMTMPQRSDFAVSMWSTEEAMQHSADERRAAEDGLEPDYRLEPVHRFEGHTDVVKEFLFRSHGGADPDHDDRRFQLLTWSKDQTLRMWNVPEFLAEEVGHKPGSKIKMRLTRAGAPDISYRVPPSEQGFINPAAVDISSTQVPAASSVSSAKTREELSASWDARKGRMPPSPSGKSRDVPLASSVPNQLLTSMPRSSPKPGSFRPPEAIGRLLRSGPGPDARVSTRIQSAIAPGSLAAPSTGSHSTGTRQTMSPLERRMAALLPHVANEVNSTAFPLKRLREAYPRATSMVPPRPAVVQPPRRRRPAGYMTIRGGAFQRHGQPEGQDRLDWMARVKVDRDDDSIASSEADSDDLDSEQSHSQSQSQSHSHSRSRNPVPINEEIMALNKRRVNFEKIEVAERYCIVTLYGHWARAPVFVRVRLRWPADYPNQPLEYDLDRSPKVTLRTRAYMLRNLTEITRKSAEEGTPSADKVVQFLLRTDAPSRMRLDDSDASTDDEDAVPSSMLVPPLPPRRSGAAFGPQGELVVFGLEPPRRATRGKNLARTPSRPRHGAGAAVRSQSKPPRSHSRPRELRPLSSSHPRMLEHDAPVPPRGRAGGGGELRPPRLGAHEKFVTSYVALAGAMDKLVQKSGQAEDLDVLQLMTTGFLHRRMQQDHPPRGGRGSTSRHGSTRGSRPPRTASSGLGADEMSSFTQALVELTTERSSVSIVDVSALLPPQPALPPSPCPRPRSKGFSYAQAAAAALAQAGRS